METIPTELIENILYKMELPDVLSYCRVNKTASEICRNELFWKSYLKNFWNGEDRHNQFIYSTFEKKNTWKEEVLIYYKILNQIYPSSITYRAINILIRFESDQELKPYYNMSQLYLRLKELNKIVNIHDLQESLDEELSVNMDKEIDELYNEIEPIEDIIENPEILKDLSSKPIKILDRYGYHYIIGDLESLMLLQNDIYENVSELGPLYQKYVDIVRFKYEI